MPSNSWISLNEFSTKYGISLSTLRRRIKRGQVEHEFREGKYWVKDAPAPKYLNQNHNEAAAKTEVGNLKNSSDKCSTGIEGAPSKGEPEKLNSIPSIDKSSDSEQASHLLASANKVLQELKGAYINVLQEKENQITQLKAEISNLKTLVQILEAENNRLNSNLKEAAPIDHWIQENFE